MPPQTITLDGPLTARTHLLVVRSFIHDHRIRVGDVGDIRRLKHDRDIALGWNHDASDALRSEFICRHEGVLVGSDVVIIIRPVPDAAATIEARFRRQRRPADVILARSPRDPGRRPFIAGHPDPADTAQPHPSTVMIGGPTEWLLRHPGPAGIGIDPAAICVGPPTARCLGLARLPDIAVVRCFPPGSIRFQFLVKHAVRTSRALFGRLRGLAFFRSVLRGLLHRLGHCGRFCHSGRLGWRRRGRRGFFFSQRFFTRVQVGLLLGKAFCLVCLPLSREPLLHLALDFSLLFVLRLRFLAGDKKCERCDDRENAKLFHCGIRPGRLLVIRMKLRRGQHPRQRVESTPGRCSRRAGTRHRNDCRILDLVTPGFLDVGVNREQRHRNKDNDHQPHTVARRGRGIRHSLFAVRPFHLPHRPLRETQVNRAKVPRSRP